MSRVVLITGCTTGGIGYALCEEFARQGCKVYATSRSTKTIADFSNRSIEKLELNVTCDESVQEVLDTIIAKEGKIDVVVNNAGLIAAGPLIEQSEASVAQLYETNTFAILRMCRLVVPLMAKRRSGTIVNMGSIVGEIATPWNGLYCSTKAAVHSISESLSMELKPLGISVMHLSPGAVKSNIAINATRRFALAETTLYKDYLAMIIKRMNASQCPESMPTKVFAKVVVSNALKKNPPRYMTLGGHSRVFAFFKWLPRSLVLLFLWRVYSKRS